MALRRPAIKIPSFVSSRPLPPRRSITIGSRAPKNQVYDPCVSFNLPSHRRSAAVLAHADIDRIRRNDAFYTYLSLSTSSRTPLLTLWTASWCSNCRVVAPLVRSLVESGVGEAEGGVSLALVEFDSPDIQSATPNLALTYMINSIPTLLSFDAGEAQTATKIADARKLADRKFLEEWIRAEASRHGGRGGGTSGLPGFGGLFSNWR
ncbi:hypothetical protein S7711_00537 [Stachybotrys chartarum IBT 7711]|uniref:Thioredoxin domain-containing protein n=1 Tax=Stachybotrys chartarum (strain CBS 109288 / IBT 7711) TaxID=1280523 RepID=A0A084ATN0_STACB|nr:hypothetical protein S7711_00537 [Stachybotrys chartarum IBT 7711]KFA49702.1 hypothetical protein S40293_01371 [Stachybotrys chartarum IBT 40293]